MFKCGICNKEFANIEDYLSHTKICAEKENKRQEEEANKKLVISKELDKIKKMEQDLKEAKTNFMVAHPKEYELNFGRIDRDATTDSFYGQLNDDVYTNFDEFIDAFHKYWS